MRTWKSVWLVVSIAVTVISAGSLVYAGGGGEEVCTTTNGYTTAWGRVTVGGGSEKRHLFDVDGDGWRDSISVTNWYKNPGASGSWTGYSIGNTDYPSPMYGRRVGDVDGDGLPDLVFGVGRNYPSPDRNRVYAFINPGTTGTWTRYHIGTLPDAPDGIETVAIADMNNDGHADILAGGECTLLRWYVNPGYMTGNWSYYTVYDFSQDVEGMVIKDFNNDNYLDIAVTVCSPNGLSGGTYVLTNPKTESGNWSRKTVDGDRYSCVQSISAGDVNGDGWNDVILSNRQPFVDSYLYWYKNPKGSGSWTRYRIDTLSTNHLAGWPPEVADIDLDGKPDVICYRNSANVTYWYGNRDGGDTWKRNKIYAGRITPLSYGVGDANNDGDLDIISGGNLYKNPKPGF